MQGFGGRDAQRGEVVAPTPVVVDEAVFAPLLAALRGALPAEVGEHAWAARRPAAVLAVRVLEGVLAPLGASRLGGLPDLPDDVAWPQWDGPGGAWGRRPLVFHGQVDLAGVSGHLDLDLPLDGLLLFFVDFDAEAGDMVSGRYDDEREGSRVLHVPAGTPLRRRTPPGPVRVHREALVAPLLTHSLPRAGAVGLDLHGDGEQYQAYEDAVDLGWRAQVQEHCPPGYLLSGLHQLGGHARPVQGPVEADALQAQSGVFTRGRAGGDTARWEQVRPQQAAWTLLLQLDSDDELDWWFGDLGTLYWVSPRSDLAQGEVRTARFVCQNS